MSIYIHTNRLTLREFLQADFPFIHEYAAQEEVVQYERWGPNTPEQTKEFISEAIEAQREKPRRKYELCIVETKSNKPIGGCGIYYEKENPMQAQIGYIITPEKWGNGYATEAARGLITFAKALELTKITATCDQRNSASRRVLEKAGLTCKELIKDHFMQKGFLRSSYDFELEL